MSVDLGARSLVGGVDCNDPEKSLFKKIVCYFIFVHHHALSPLRVLSNIFFIKAYFVLLVWFIKTLLFFFLL
jgi:hypothetical protein